jgi:hypothetical protein
VFQVESTADGETLEGNTLGAFKNQEGAKIVGITEQGGKWRR